MSLPSATRATAGVHIRHVQLTEVVCACHINCELSTTKALLLHISLVDLFITIVHIMPLCVQPHLKEALMLVPLLGE